MGVGAELEAVFHIGAADVDLQPADPASSVQGTGQVGVVGDALAGDVHDHGDTPAGPHRSDIAEYRLKTDVLKADGVDHPCGGLGHAGLDVAPARAQRDRLADDGAQPLDVEDLDVLQAVAEGARRRHDRVGQR